MAWFSAHQWYLLPLVLLCTPGVRIQGSSNTEAAALLQIKSGFTNGDVVLPDWDSDAGSPCSWKEIECFGDSVHVINITSKGLRGTITPEGWADLKGLETLDMSDNELTGTIPKLPESLTVLSLSNNSVNGTIPKLPERLMFLQLDNNILKGTIPNLPESLEDLDLSSNMLEGTIPKLPERLMNLSLMSVGLNRLTGTIPKLPESLQGLDLTLNSLTGTIPKLPERLMFLQLSSNILEGTIPKLPEGLQVLDLYQVNLTGTIPKLPERLRNLDISFNSLTGTIPKLPEILMQLDMDNNILTGTIPELPESLEGLYLFLNSLSGTIPKLPDSLVDLDLSSNRLEGTIPELPESLGALDLGSNVLSGTIPNLPESSVHLSLAINRLKGTLPKLKLPKSLLSLDLSGNDLSGTFPMFDFPESLSLLDLSYNNLSGTLPRINASQNIRIQVLPQKGDGFCGKVPPNNIFYDDDMMRVQGFRLPNCTLEQPPSTSRETSDSSSNSVGVAVGLAVGCAALVAAALAVWWYVWHRQHASNVEPDSLEPGPNSRDPVLEMTLKEARSSDIGAASNPGSRHNLEHLKMWLVEFKDIQLIKQVGEGSYGRVYLAKWKEMLVACKILLNTPLDVCTGDTSVQAAAQPVTLSNPVLQNLHKEAGIMAALRHPNIISFLGVCPSPPCVLSEFCSQGSLADVFRDARQSPQIAAELDWLRRLSMMMDCAKGLLYLHERNPPIIHRDLKAANVLVDGNWKAKVADFNLSRIVAEESLLSSAQAGNPRWLAPEVLNGEPASQQSDVFSYGIVLWESLTWSVPFASEKNHWPLVKFVSNGGRPGIPPLEALPGQDTASFQGLGEYIDLIQRCWAQDPAERPSFSNVVADLRAMLASTLKQVHGPTPKQHGQDGTSEPVVLHTTQQSSANAGSESAETNVQPSLSTHSL